MSNDYYPLEMRGNKVACDYYDRTRALVEEQAHENLRLRAEVESLRRLLNECREMLDIVHLQTGWKHLKYAVDAALSQPAATGEAK